MDFGLKDFFEGKKNSYFSYPQNEIDSVEEKLKKILDEKKSVECSDN
jgi:hypothetical protein